MSPLISLSLGALAPVTGAVTTLLSALTPSGIRGRRPQGGTSRAEEGAAERQRIFDLSLDMMCATTFDGRLLCANPRFEKVLGWTQAELRAKPFMEFVHPDDHASTLAEIERLRQGHPTTNFQNRALCRDGAYKVFSWRSVPDRERGIMYSVARDITDDEQIFRSFVEHSTQVVWMEDPESQRIVYVSPAYERIWGRSCSGLYADPHGWLEAIHPEDRGSVEAAWKAQHRTGTFTERYRVIRPDGSVRWISDRGFAIRTAAGRITRVAGIAEDVTDQHETEARLRRRERLASVGTLAAGIAHEINNPLGAITLAAESALKATDDRTAVERALREIIDATKRSGRIVDSVLKFAREETLEKSPADLNGVVRHATVLFSRHAENRGTIVRTVLAPAPLRLLLNQTEMEQALINLLENACDAGARHITVRTEQLAGTFWLTVEDDGSGISEAVSARVFEPFYTTRREQGGSGLGLSITHGIITDHNGTISIEPRAGAGTRVIVRFSSTDTLARKEAGNGQSARR